MIVIDNPNPEDHLRTEWLLTNGLGGYAMGTVLGMNTRRYHGLLVAATKPPVGRVVALHSMIEQLVIPKDDGSEEVIDLSTQMFLDEHGEPMLHPDGWKALKSFEFRPGGSVTWRWFVRGLRISNHVRAGLFSEPFNCMHSHMVVHDAVPRGAFLRQRPLISFRGFHSLNVNGHAEPTVTRERRGIVVHGDSGSFLIASFRSVWSEQPQWWNDFALIEERGRGLEWTENIWSPGVFTTPVSPHGTLRSSVLMAPMPDWDAPSEDDSDPDDEDEFFEEENSSTRAILECAAQSFVVRRTSNEDTTTSIIAGYPWFADWGRDAMISLPGLLLTNGRFDEAKSVLDTFASHIKHGLIPNRFDDDGGEPYYNTVDASLWFVYAVWLYLRARGEGGETSALPKGESPLIAACRDIINAYTSGIQFEDNRSPELSFSIRVDADGLITAGDEHTQLTWMDAKRDGIIFTPRHGKAVEVNALWYNALHCFADLTEVDSEARDLRELASRVERSFRDAFWWEDHNCLHDVLIPCQTQFAADGKLRPNQILAASLPYSPLTREQQRAVVACVRERFLTPFGLRTLDRSDPDYCGRYEGNLFERDRAYHNGTAWPWLIGPFCEALLRINDFSAESKQEVRAIIQPLLDELRRTTGPRCLGQIAEIFDGDEPQRPQGCTAQAWSVAEVLRVKHLVGNLP